MHMHPKPTYVVQHFPTINRQILIEQNICFGNWKPVVLETGFVVLETKNVVSETQTQFPKRVSETQSQFRKQRIPQANF